jgi:hypothetical protein
MRLRGGGQRMYGWRFYFDRWSGINRHAKNPKTQDGNSATDARQVDISDGIPKGRGSSLAPFKY